MSKIFATGRELTLHSRHGGENHVNDMTMNSSVPYLIRAINEWILDNDCTPYMIVDAAMDDVSVPMEFVEDGQIVLNISPQAIRNLVIADKYVMFSGRFSGVAHEVYAPIAAVMGVVTKENGEGMWFPREDSEPPGSPNTPRGVPHLKVVK